MDGYHTFTKIGSVKRAPYSVTCHWIDECWAEVTVEKWFLICKYTPESINKAITGINENEKGEGNRTRVPENFCNLSELFNI